MEGIGRWAVVAATCVAIAACGSSAKASTPTASQLLSAARSNLDGLASYRVAGSVTAAEVSVQLTATVLKNGDSSGSITSAGVAKFVVVQRAVYFDTLTPAVTGALDKSMLDLAVRLKGPHWWRTAGSTSTQRAMSLLTASGLAPVFLDGRTKLTETSTKDSKGRAAYKLSDNAGSLFVSRTTPYRVLEITTAPDYLAASTSNVDLVFDEFNAPASVSVPAGFVPLSQELLPPYFYVSSLDLVGKCNTGGCTIKGVVTAATSPGTAKVTFTVYDANDKRLSSCTTSVVISRAYGTGNVQCRASSAAWTSWLYNVGGTFRYKGTIDNPDYNPESS